MLSPDEWLKKLQADQGFTSRDALADALGVAKMTVLRWGLHGRSPRMANARKLATLANVTIDEVFKVFEAREAA